MPFDPILIIFIFPVLWFISTLSSKMFSGWGLLEKHYICRIKYNGELISPLLLRIGIFKYNGCISFGCSSQGLYLRPGFFYKPFHNDLLIPWNKISFSWQYFMFIKYGVFTVNVGKPVKIAMGEISANKILQAYNTYR